MYFWKRHRIGNLKSDVYVCTVIFMSAILEFKIAAVKMDSFKFISAAILHRDFI